VYTLKSIFIKTPARKMIQIKEDFTDKRFDPDFYNERMGKILGQKLDGAKVRMTITVWQDEADTVVVSGFEEGFTFVGCEDFEMVVIRKPRETVRSEKVMDAVSLPDKLDAMGILRGEVIGSGVMQKAVDLQMDAKMWEKDYERIEGGINSAE